MPIEFSGMFQ